MAHPAIAVLEAIIAEEEVKITALQTEYQDLMKAENITTWDDYLRLSANVMKATLGMRNAQLVARLAQIQIAVLAEE